MAATISSSETLDIAFDTITFNGQSGTFTWKLNDPHGSITTVTQIRQTFGFNSDGDPSTGTGLFGSLYQDGLRLTTKNNDTLQAISGARKVEVITTKEDLPM